MLMRRRRRKKKGPGAPGVEGAPVEGAPEGAAGIKKRLTDDLLNFIGNCPQNDDITLIAIRKT